MLRGVYKGQAAAPRSILLGTITGRFQDVEEERVGGSCGVRIWQSWEVEEEK